MTLPHKLTDCPYRRREDRATDRAAGWRLGGVLLILCLISQGSLGWADEPAKFDVAIAPLFKERCVKCHGPAKAEAELDLSTAAAVVRGGENGPIVVSHQVDDSLLWERVVADEMPPKHPLTADEKARIKAWILAGAPGLPARSSKGDADHWAFRKLAPVQPPSVKNEDVTRGPLDRFIEAALEREGGSLAPEAPRQRLIRRVSLSLTGLTPSPSDVAAYLDDKAPDAYSRMVERFLASPRYGERWGKYWLDAAGYADSNGYFNADSDRPLAYRYRDYVVRAFNADLTFDRFLREQLAGDELPGYEPGQPITAETADRLIATHFLRNGQDGSGESDGNPDEVRVDRYTALESCQQIVASALLGLTIQCAKCHSHKFEPITHEDYYRFQAIFAPVFPAATDSLWIKPQARFVLAPTADQKRQWDRQIKAADDQAALLQASLREWASKNRPRGEVVFLDDFESDAPLKPRWSNTAPTDDKPGGSPPVTVDSDKAPAARSRNGRLEVIAGTTLDSWLTTTQSFDWTPDHPGESIQATFDLVDTRLSAQGKSAERVGYFLATHDFDDSGKLSGGNILVDGHPTGSTSVLADYPGRDATPRGAIGRTGYVAGRNYGVRVTNVDKGQFRLEQLVDGFPEVGAITLAAGDLPDGGFGFEYHADRSFVVDNVRIERFGASAESDRSSIADRDAEFGRRQKELDAARNQANGLKNAPPFKIAWATDVTPTPPETHLLERGDYARPGKAMAASPLSALASGGASFASQSPAGGRTTGRRLALANWLTDPNERAAALMARVQVNRIWQSHFGTGIVATPENLGLSGAPPTHPELLDWLAFEFVRSGWSVKHVHRQILDSATFRQSSDAEPSAPTDDRSLGRFPAVRLDAETIRDCMLGVSGELDTAMGGPYVPIQATGDGAVVVPDSQPGGLRRSIYLQQRRTQPVSLLQVFDAPTIVFNSLRRPRTAMPLQSLALMNSDFVRARAKAFASRLEREEPDQAKRIPLAFLTAWSREPSLEERQAATGFLDEQSRLYGLGAEGRNKAWVDFCQSMLMSNEFLYLD
jgi:hypothetical protein